MNDHWKQRVRVEREEVHGRMTRLLKFLESSESVYVAKAERVRLLNQLDVMRQYRKILDERIEANFQ